MRIRTGCPFILAALAASNAAHANVFFGFTPVANGLETEVTYSAGNANGPGFITFADDVTVDLVVDGSAFGAPIGVEHYNARLSFNLTVGQATPTGAPVQGTITFAVGGADILVGTAGPGSGMLVGAPFNAAALIFSNYGGQAFQWEHFGALSDQLGTIEFNSFADASFAFSYALFTGEVNQFGYYESFWANAAFAGFGEYLFPSPGGAALFGGAACLLGSRRRRANVPCH